LVYNNSTHFRNDLNNNQKTNDMKTKGNSRLFSIIRSVILLPLMIISIAALTSCGKSQNGATGIPEAPPPPPPPPPPAASADTVFVNVDEMPVFTGGAEGLLNYIAKNTKYPEEAKAKGIQGKVIVRFVVEKDGTVSTASIVKGAEATLDAEAVRVVSTLPKFETPAKVAGSPVRVHYMVPISFNLK
jgi:protein TonB